jgi:ketosteroid isomerase-like protein
MSDNLSRLKACYKAWNDTKGDREAWRELLAEPFTLQSIDEHARGLGFAKDRFSREETLDYLTAIFKEWEMLHFTPETFVSEGDLIAVFGRMGYRHKETGKTAEARMAHLWRFEGGKAAGIIEIFDTAVAVAAATPD